jgi:predicted amidohydrolase YtcJ
MASFTRTLPRVFAALLLFISAARLCFGQTAPPDLLLIHGHIVTMNPKQPVAEAIAITGDGISWIGSDRDAQALSRSAKKTIDLHGVTVLPGIIDAHTHLVELGKSLLRLNLKDVASPEAAIAQVKARAQSTPPGQWILGWGWDEGQWASHYPDNEALSKAVPDHPVYLVGLHGFAAWANKRALQLSSITKNTTDPENGKIVRNEKTGEPTGILLNRAQELVERQIPPMTLKQTKEAVLKAAEVCIRNGLTSIHEARVSGTMVQAYWELTEDNQMPLRIYAMLDGADKSLVQEWLMRGPHLDPRERFTIRAFKLFADGALGSRGAWMVEPYSDAPQTKGVVTTPEAQIESLTREALKRGFQVATHAIGDAANRMTLDAYEKAMHEVPAARDPRLRIEHAQVLAPQDIPRFAQLHVIPSMQPTHCTSDMPWAEKRVGPERIKGAYAWQSLAKTGVHLPLSSDFPGETLNPFYGIYAAITRQDPQGNPPGGWHPEQRLTLDQALRGYTIEAAYAEFEEESKGSLESGKLADLIVIDKDITKLAATPKEILTIQVLKTIIGGKVVYEANGISK